MSMSFAARFRQGMKAAVPIWIAFVPSSLAWGIAAQDHGLSLGEVVLMSAWVYSGPAQFAVLSPLAEGKSALQVLVAGFLMNLRFLPMSTALAPLFRGAKRRHLLLASHVISASSFIVPYMQFQKERAARSANNSAGNERFCVVMPRCFKSSIAACCMRTTSLSTRERGTSNVPAARSASMT